MTNDELEAGFAEAQAEWFAANPGHSHFTIQQRYFFWAGAQFGTEVTAAIYRETYGDTHVSKKMRMPDEIVGEPV